MPPAPKTIRRAADLRAAGHSWEIVAKRLRRCPEIVSQWPDHYAETWRVAYEQARTAVLAEAEAEALCVLRQQLRAEDEKVRLDAARKLIDRSADANTNASGSIDSPLARIANQLEGLSDVELITLLGRLREQTPDHRSVDSQSAELPASKA